MENISELINVLWRYIQRLGEHAIWKTMLSSIIAAIVFLCGDISAPLLSFMILLFLDMVTGIWRAHKKGDEIKSDVAKKGAIKIIVYFILIILGHSLEVIGLPYTRGLALIYASLTEGKSILENLEEISGKLPLICYLNRFLDKVAKDNDIDLDTDDEIGISDKEVEKKNEN